MENHRACLKNEFIRCYSCSCSEGMHVEMLIHGKAHETLNINERCAKLEASKK